MQAEGIPQAQPMYGKALPDAGRRGATGARRAGWCWVDDKAVNRTYKLETVAPCAHQDTQPAGPGDEQVARNQNQTQYRQAIYYQDNYFN